MTTLAPSNTTAPAATVEADALSRALAGLTAAQLLDYAAGLLTVPGVPDPARLLDLLTPTDRARVERFAAVLPDAPVSVGGCRCVVGRRFQPRNA